MGLSRAWAHWKSTSTLLLPTALALEYEARIGWCLVCCAGGDRVWLWASSAFHMASCISQGTVWVSANQAKNVLISGTGAMVFIQGFSQKAFQMSHWEVYFQTSVQDRTCQPLCSRCPWAAFSRLLKESQTQDLDCTSEGWPEIGVNKKLSFSSLLKNFIR